MRVAVVDLGTNTTRLLVADIVDGTLDEVHRETRFTRLGEGVDARRRLLPVAIARVRNTLSDYRRTLESLGSERTLLVATSAVRDAENGEALLGEIEWSYGFATRLLSGEDEAAMTVRGVGSGRAPSPGTLILDIGGGSTELIVGAGAEISFHASLQAGVVRHTERHISSDPPTAVELEALATDVRGLIEAAIAGHDAKPEARTGIAVAGTPTSLAAIEMELAPYDPERVHGHILSLPPIQRMFSRLASAPLAERTEIAGLHPDRAPTIVAGVVILVETMRAFGLDSIEVSEHDILYGAAIAAASECG